MGGAPGFGTEALTMLQVLTCGPSPDACPLPWLMVSLCLTNLAGANRCVEAIGNGAGREWGAGRETVSGSCMRSDPDGPGRRCAQIAVKK